MSTEPSTAASGWGHVSCLAVESLPRCTTHSCQVFETNSTTEPNSGGHRNQKVGAQNLHCIQGAKLPKGIDRAELTMHWLTSQQQQQQQQGHTLPPALLSLSTLMSEEVLSKELCNFSGKLTSMLATSRTPSFQYLQIQAAGKGSHLIPTKKLICIWESVRPRV